MKVHNSHHQNTNATLQPRPGKYRHYKGKFYEVIGSAYHTETLEELVVYRALYDEPTYGPNALWVRPKSMFLEEIEVNGQRVRRFSFVE